MRALYLLLLLPTIIAAAPAPPTARPLLAPAPVAVQNLTPPALCDAAITSAETTARLPPRILAAIALQESGRYDREHGRVRPWPWTINAEGAGLFFVSKAEAITAVEALRTRGVNSIDVGCMQVNLLHHPNAFVNLDEAFDPRANARYAARFLGTLFNNSRDWVRAIGSYHSETPALGEAYRTQVVARWQSLGAVLTTTAMPRYGDFAGTRQAYAAFAPIEQVYGAFAGARRSNVYLLGPPAGQSTPR